MTALGEKVRAMIRAQGPITVADYMALCLGDPEHGYYMTRDPFGAAGDFTTAPEISQLFGELIGVWLLAMWRQIGAPDPVHLVELGPGRGTLMADILRVSALDTDYRQSLDVYLVETSPRLRTIQERTLKDVDVAITWADRLGDIPAGPTLLVANELFDALPIHQLVHQHGTWHPRTIGLDHAGVLTLGLGPPSLPPADQAMPGPPKTGTVREACPAGIALMAEIAGRIMDHGGAALIVDYGYCGPAFGDTLQALRDHAPVDPLADPGEADLTAHVDFHALAEAARAQGAAVHGPVEQGAFLRALGLLERAGQLGAHKTADIQAEIQRAVDRLATPDQMGTLFKVIAVTRPGCATFGFDTSPANAQDRPQQGAPS